jgi:hypothetical protein
VYRHQQPLFLFAPQQLLFGRLTQGDVAGHGGGADDQAVAIVHRRDGEADIAALAAPRDPHGVMVIEAAAALDSIEDQLPLAGAIRRNQHGHRLAQRVRRRVAEQLLGAGVPRSDRPVQGRADDRVAARRDDGREQRVSFDLELERLVGLGQRELPGLEPPLGRPHRFAQDDDRSAGQQVDADREGLLNRWPRADEAGAADEHLRRQEADHSGDERRAPAAVPRHERHRREHRRERESGAHQGVRRALTRTATATATSTTA